MYILIYNTIDTVNTFIVCRENPRTSSTPTTPVTRVRLLTARGVGDAIQQCYIYIYIYIHHIHMYIYTYIHTCIHTHTHIIYIYIYIYKYIYIYIYFGLTPPHLLHPYHAGHTRRTSHLRAVGTHMSNITDQHLYCRRNTYTHLEWGEPPHLLHCNYPGHPRRPTHLRRHMK